MADRQTDRDKKTEKLTYIQRERERGGGGGGG